MAPLRCAAKFDPFLSLDCAPRPTPHTPRKGRDQILPSGNLTQGGAPHGAAQVHLRGRRGGPPEVAGGHGHRIQGREAGF